MTVHLEVKEDIIFKNTCDIYTNMNSISNINQINLEYLIEGKLIVKWKEKNKYVEYYVLG